MNRKQKKMKYLKYKYIEKNSNKVIEELKKEYYKVNSDNQKIDISKNKINKSVKNNYENNNSTTSINKDISYIGFIEKDIKGDGNSFYYISSEKFYDKFRKLIANFIKENIDRFMRYVYKIKKQEKFLNYIEHNTRKIYKYEWGYTKSKTMQLTSPAVFWRNYYKINNI